MYNDLNIMERSSERFRIIESINRRNILSVPKEIWLYRELLFMLAWRDYKVKYKQTAIGIAWAILQPILAMIAFAFIFGRFKEISSTGVPYPLFVYSGLLIWKFFANSVTESSISLVASSQIITKIFFPRILIPLSKVATQLIDLAFSSIILIGLMIYFHISPPLLSYLYFIPLLISLIIVSASVGIIISAINVKFRDIQYVLPYFIQLGLFVSPIIYTSANFGNFGLLMDLNPLTGIIDALRYALFGTPLVPQSLLISCSLTLLLFMISIYYFNISEGKFSDII